MGAHGCKLCAVGECGRISSLGAARAANSRLRLPTGRWHSRFFSAGADAQALHVAFLADLPAKAKLAALDPKRSPPDEFVVRGREVYLHCPNGVGRSKLSNEYFDSKLATTSTIHNRRTLLTLLELA